ncbi:MAG: phosphatidylglycerophosphatase A [Phycisphaerales bacterium]|nr:phosphatidylglycerophosphatase A [Phycisphaerales bacterium]
MYACEVFGLGRLPFAPGSWGSLPPVVLAFGLTLLGTSGREIDMSVGLLGILFGVICLVWGDHAEKCIGKKDPGRVVADEVAGQAIALMWLPWSSNWARNFAICSIAFVAFRIFDVIKPPPARRLQKIHGGAGILVDDLIAGLYALALTQIIVRTANL